MKLLTNEKITTQDLRRVHEVLGANDRPVFFAWHGNKSYNRKTNKDGIIKLIDQVLDDVAIKDWVRLHMLPHGLEVSIATEPEQAVLMTHVLGVDTHGFRR